MRTKWAIIVQDLPQKLPLMFCSIWLSGFMRKVKIYRKITDAKWWLKKIVNSFWTVKKICHFVWACSWQRYFHCIFWACMTWVNVFEIYFESPFQKLTLLIQFARCGKAILCSFLLTCFVWQDTISYCKLMYFIEVKNWMVFNWKIVQT